jgi:hypothetical protein
VIPINTGEVYGSRWAGWIRNVNFVIAKTPKPLPPPNPDDLVPDYDVRVTREMYCLGRYVAAKTR